MSAGQPVEQYDLWILNRIHGGHRVRTEPIEAADYEAARNIARKRGNHLPRGHKIVRIKRLTDVRRPKA